MSDAAIFDNIDPELKRKFKEYHIRNPEVYNDFVRHATYMKSTGRKRYSQWVIINKMRWDSDIKTTGDVFKISNDFIALYARLLVFHKPEFSGFFELKKMKAKRNMPSNETIKRIRKESQLSPWSAGVTI